MNTILDNLKKNKGNFNIINSILLRKIGSNNTSVNKTGLTIKQIIQSDNCSVNLIFVTSVQIPEVYIVYYDNVNMDNATSECVIQINFDINTKQIGLTETNNGHALIREYGLNQSQTCKDIINFITQNVNDNKNVKYSLKTGTGTYPVYSGSIVDKLNSILSNLIDTKPSTLTSTTNSLVNLANTTNAVTNTVATTMAQNPALQQLASNTTNKLAQSKYGKSFSKIGNTINTIKEDPLAKELISTSKKMATDKLSKSESGKNVLQVMDTGKDIKKNLSMKGGNMNFHNYVNFIDMQISNN